MVSGDAVEGGNEFSGTGYWIKGGLNGTLDCYAGARGKVVGVEEFAGERVDGD